MNLVEEDLITWCGRAACARVSLVAGGAGAGRPLLHHRALRVGAAGAAGTWVPAAVLLADGGLAALRAVPALRPAVGRVAEHAGLAGAGAGVHPRQGPAVGAAGVGGAGVPVWGIRPCRTHGAWGDWQWTK